MRHKNIIHIFSSGVLIFLFVSCHQIPSKELTKKKTLKKFNDKLLFIGQDITSINGYKDHCTDCPLADGYVTYINLELLLKPNFYGALGYTKKKKPYIPTIDWGGGPLNAYKLVNEHPNTAIQVGLYLVNALDKVNNGKLDQEIKHLASFFSEFPDNTFYLRIGYEFDGYWNQYEPGAYKKAYQAIVEKLNDKGVTNVQFVWQSCTSPVDDILDEGKEDIMQYYPGDGYVDWFGLSWFLQPDEGPKGSTQVELAQELVNLARVHNKPVLICESSNQGYDNLMLTNSNISPLLDGNSKENTIQKTADEIWSEWYQPYFTFIENHSDVIQAITYINADWDSQDLWNRPFEQGYWGDSRLEVNDTLKYRWTNAIKKYQRQ